MPGEPSENRAASGIFCGLDRAAGDSRNLAAAGNVGAMHGRERDVLGALVVLSLVVIPFVEWSQVLPFAVAVPAAVATGVLGAHLLPVILRIRKPCFQWWAVLVPVVIWAALNTQAPGIAGFAAWAWIAIGMLELAGWCAVGWRRSGWFRLAVFYALVAALICVYARWGFLPGFVAGNLAAGWICHAILHPASQWLGTVATEVEPENLLITIDDGPCADTRELLDLLDAAETKAVFFLIGSQAEKFPAETREIAARGHVIGNHTQTHPQGNFWCAGFRRTRREIGTCQATLEKITGETPRWFRAPVGHRNWVTHPVCRALGLRVMAWNCRGYDAVEGDPQKVLGKILPAMKPGGIVLLHQGRPHSPEILRAVLERRKEIVGINSVVKGGD